MEMNEDQDEMFPDPEIVIHYAVKSSESEGEIYDFRGLGFFSYSIQILRKISTNVQLFSQLCLALYNGAETFNMRTNDLG